MDRRNFLTNFSIWILSFFFGYRLGNTEAKNDFPTTIEEPKNKEGGNINAKSFGAIGDGVTDDTKAIQNAINASKGNTLIIPNGVYKITETLHIPRNTKIKGQFNSSWFPFGQRRKELVENVLDMNNGTILKFVGKGSQKYNTNREDFRRFSCAVKLEQNADGVNISNLKILCDFSIWNDNNQMTTPKTDNAAQYDIGLWINNADHIKLDNISVVGYWKKAGVLIDASGRLAKTGEYGGCEYISLSRCTIQGKIGLALVGGDEGNPPDEKGYEEQSGDSLTEGQFGLSHFFASDCFFSGTDHHSNGFVNGWESRIIDDSTAIFIDGYIGTGIPYRINNPRFVNCSIQTRESASIVLNRVSRPTFVNCRAEAGPIRASKYTALPMLVNCEFPYSRLDLKYQEIEHCVGANITPSFRRLSHIPLNEYEFIIELRNNKGVIEHRINRRGAIRAGTRVPDAERLFRYAIKEAKWNYKSWTQLPVPIEGAKDNFSKGMYLGEKEFTKKYSLSTSIIFEDDENYQEASITIIEFRGKDPNFFAKASGYNADAVPHRLSTYSHCLKIDFRNGSNPATNLVENLPKETNGSASLKLLIKGKFYEQAYGLA